MKPFWDTAKGQELLTLSPPGHLGQVNGLAFSRDGSYLAAASNDGTVRVFNATPEGKPGAGAFPGP
jgi:WD40 repeat protein